MRSAPELLPLWDVLDDGVVVTTGGQLLRLFRLTGLDSEHLAGSVLESAATQLYAGTQDDFPDGLFAQFVVEGHDRYDDVFDAFEEVPPPLDPVLRLQRERRLAFLSDPPIADEPPHNASVAEEAVGDAVGDAARDAGADGNATATGDAAAARDAGS